MKVISFLNMKGGTGKTTTAQNFSYELYKRGYKVLMIDNDKQGNLSRAYDRYRNDGSAPAAKLLSGEWQQATELIRFTRFSTLDIIPSNMALMAATWMITAQEEESQIERFKRLIEDQKVKEYYDYIIIDNPPDIGLNVINALAVTDEVIVPVKIDEWSLEGLEILLDQIDEVRRFNNKIKVRGIVVTCFQRTPGEEAGIEWITEKSKKDARYNVLGKIRYSKKVSESTFMARPIYEYSPCCAMAQDYKKLVTQYTREGR